MRTHLSAILPTTSLLLLFASVACAGDDNFVDWHSPMRPQFELVTRLSNELDLRFGVNRLDPLSAGNPLQPGLAGQTTPVYSASALVDWQLLPNGLHLTGGALYGDLGWSHLEHSTGFAAERSDLYSLIASHTTERNRLDNVKPYLGLGWDNQFGADGRFRLQLDLGLVFQSVFPANEDAMRSGYSDKTGEDVRLGQTFQSFRYMPLFSAGFRYQF